MEENEIRAVLFNSVNEIDLPDDLTIDKIVNRAFSFKHSGDSISFLIYRHPGLGGRMSRGRGIGLNAFWNEETKYTYKLKTKEWSIEILSSELWYDEVSMADEEITSLEGGGFFPTSLEDEESVLSIIKEAKRIISDCYIEAVLLDNVGHEKLEKMLSEILDAIDIKIREKYPIINR